MRRVSRSIHNPGKQHFITGPQDLYEGRLQGRVKVKWQGHDGRTIRRAGE